MIGFKTVSNIIMMSSFFSVKLTLCLINIASLQEILLYFKLMTQVRKFLETNIQFDNGHSHRSNKMNNNMRAAFVGRHYCRQLLKL